MILVAGEQVASPPSPMLAIPQGGELVVILLVVALLFGSKKLPDLARSTGRSLRIFKSETRGLLDDAETRDRDAARSPVD